MRKCIVMMENLGSVFPEISFFSPHLIPESLEDDFVDVVHSRSVSKNSE